LIRRYQMNVRSVSRLTVRNNPSERVLNSLKLANDRIYSLKTGKTSRFR